MNSSDDLCQAQHHLRRLANANWNHLLRDKDHEQWSKRVLQSAACSAALEILAEVSALCPVERKGEWLPDLGFSASDLNIELVDNQP